MSYLSSRAQRVCAILLASTVLALPMAPALAQQAPAATGDEQGHTFSTERTDDGAIIVTATRYVPQGSVTANKTNIPLIETPQSVSVITRDQIDLLSFVDVQQAVRYTAGVFGENYGPDPRYDFVTVRGFTPRQYIDGLAVPATTTIASPGVDLYAFDSIDILKGPSSVLYGAAPPGGIINEVSRRPLDEFGGELRVRGGTHAFWEGAGTVTGPANDFIDVRATGLYRNTHGTIDHQRVQRVLAAPSATLKISPDTRLTGLLYYQYDENKGGNGGFLPAYGTLLDSPTGERIGRSNNLDSPGTEFQRRQFGAGYDFEQKFGSNLRFVSNTKWSDYKEETPVGIYSGGGFVNTTDPTLPSYYRTVQQYNFSYREKVTSFTTDNRLDGTLVTGPVTQKLLFGVDYRNVRNSAAYGFVFAGTLDAFDPVYDSSLDVPIGYPTRYNNQRLQQTGVYGQDQIGFGNLFVTLGGRYDWVRVKTAAPFVSSSDPAVFGDAEKQHKFTYRVGANYVTDIGIAPYVSYSTSFEPVLGTDAVTGDNFKPTSVKQYEGGVKYDARGLSPNVKIFATAAVFDIKEKNFVVAQVGATPIGGTQGGLVEVYGAEFEVVARISEQLSLNAAYSYNHSKVKSSPNAPGDIGAELPTTPKHKASFFGDYTFQRGALAGFGFGGGVRYNSDSAGGLPSTTFGIVPGEAIRTGEVTLFDAILHYDLPGWRVAVNGSNIFDKRYVARCSGLYGCVYGASRQVLATVTKKF